MVVACLISAGFARGYDSDSIIARCVDYDQNSTQGISAKSDKTRLSFRVGILDCEAKGISERLLGMREADAVFA